MISEKWFGISYVEKLEGKFRISARPCICNCMFTMGVSPVISWRSRSFWDKRKGTTNKQGNEKIRKVV